jgi:hypothetical protein
MARIGEILIEHGWVDPTNLKRALAEQSMTGGKRVCSLLIARGLLDPDHAARALGEQQGCPAVLQRHLEHRDPALQELLDPTFARTYFALPIGRTRAGEVIVCVRDPGPEVEQAIKRVITQPVVIAVAPAAQLEELIDRSYAAVDEFDVDLSTGTQIEAPDGLEPADGEFSLADLDDVRVTKLDAPTFIPPTRTTPPPFASVTPPGGFNPPTEPPKRISPFASISPPIATATEEPRRAPTQPPPRAATEPLLPPAPPPAIGTQPPTAPLPLPSLSKPTLPPLGAPSARPHKSSQSPTQISIEDVALALDDAASRDLATDVAMRYASQRWTSSLLLAVKEGAALGHRGHGSALTPEAVRAVAIPLTTPSIIQAAHDQGALVREAPAGPIQERVAKLLGQPTEPLAAPVAVAGHTACILAVGDQIGNGDSAADLDRLASVLGTAYTRIHRDMK